MLLCCASQQNRPHIYVTWDVKDQSEKVVQWIGELASRNNLLADGMTKDSLKPGGEALLPFAQQSQERLKGFKKIMKPDGTAVLSYSRAGGGSPEERARAGER